MDISLAFMLSTMPMQGCIAGERNISFVRFYLSDAANQQTVLKNAIGAMRPALSGVPVSVIGQPPLYGTKIAAWLVEMECIALI